LVTEGKGALTPSIADKTVKLNEFTKLTQNKTIFQRNTKKKQQNFTNLKLQV
jgi:hypothetical protein